VELLRCIVYSHGDCGSVDDNSGVTTDDTTNYYIIWSWNQSHFTAVLSPDSNFEITMMTYATDN